MTPQSLLASAGINFGLALIVLALFSILKNQPSNACVYFARPLSENHSTVSFAPFSYRRFLPSISWISRAWHVSEDDILHHHGLDALVIFRLFKFGINFFVVCSLVGLIILLPLNYSCHDWPVHPSESMSTFTISNVPAGSNWLWVHFSCLWLVSFYGLYLLYKENKEILAKRIQHLRKLRDQPEQFAVLVREIPLCPEHMHYGCNVDHFFRKNYQHCYQSYQMLYNEKKFHALVNEGKSMSRKIKKFKEKTLIKESQGRSTLSEPLRRDGSEILAHEKLQKISDQISDMQCGTVIQDMEFPVAFVIFKSRVGAALAAQAHQHPHSFLWVTNEAPEPRDVLWMNLSIRSRKLLLYKILFFVAAGLLTIFFAFPVAAVQGIAKFDKLKKWFPPAIAIQLIPGLRSIVTGYLPSVILNGFIYVVPFSLLGMAHVAGYFTKSEMEIKVCHMVYYFLVGNVFFLSLLSGSLLDELGESFAHPSDFPSHLARAVAAQADFFTTYILTDGLSGFSLEILQAGLLTWDTIRSCVYGRRKEKYPYLFSLPYFRVIPYVSLSILIGMVYAVVAPLLLPFLVGYLFLGYAVYINQIEDVYCISYETCGQYWPYIHHYIFFAFVLMQITMIGLFGLNSKPEAAVATIPLLILTLMFNEYCKLRFLPSFRHHPVQDAMERDDLDENDGKLEQNSENAVRAYCPPCLRPVSFDDEIGSSSDRQHLEF